MFYPSYNKRYHYSTNEILSIIEQQCKLFVSVLDEINPDYLLSNVVTRLPMYLIYKLAKARNINVLVLEPWHSLTSQCLLSKQIDSVDDPHKYSETKISETKDLKELKYFLESYPSSNGSEFQVKIRNSRFNKLKNSLNLLKNQLMMIIKIFTLILERPNLKH